MINLLLLISLFIELLSCLYSYFKKDGHSSLVKKIRIFNLNISLVYSAVLYLDIFEKITLTSVMKDYLFLGILFSVIGLGLINKKNDYRIDLKKFFYYLIILFSYYFQNSNVLFLLLFIFLSSWNNQLLIKDYKIKWVFPVIILPLALLFPFANFSNNIIQGLFLYALLFSISRIWFFSKEKTIISFDLIPLIYIIQKIITYKTEEINEVYIFSVYFISFFVSLLILIRDHKGGYLRNALNTFSLFCIGLSLSKWSPDGLINYSLIVLLLSNFYKTITDFKEYENILFFLILLLVFTMLPTFPFFSFLLSRSIIDELSLKIIFPLLNLLFVSFLSFRLIRYYRNFNLTPVPPSFYFQNLFIKSFLIVLYLFIFNQIGLTNIKTQWDINLLVILILSSLLGCFIGHFLLFKKEWHQKLERSIEEINTKLDQLKLFNLIENLEWKRKIKKKGKTTFFYKFTIKNNDLSLFISKSKYLIIITYIIGFMIFLGLFYKFKL